MRRQKLREFSQRRRGAIIVLAAFLMIAMMAMLALSIDTGYMYTMQTQLDRAVDSAALAGAGSLVKGVDQANAMATEYLVRNPVGKAGNIVTNNNLAQQRAEFLNLHANDFAIEVGSWDPTLQRFQADPSSPTPSAIHVSMTYPDLPLFFGRVFGKNSFRVRSEAVAMYQPRDIMVVLDFSGSMNDDSEFRSINKFGKQAIMDGLQQIYQELGAPVYGDLEFLPKYIRVTGQAESNTWGQVTVEYRYKSVSVTSTRNLDNVVLKFANGRTQKFSGLSGTTGTFKGSGSNNNKTVRQVWVKSGNNLSGDGPDYGELFNFSSSAFNSVAKAALNLNSVPYPYPSGSWSSFINYCKSGSSNRRAGFRYMFGYANLINYWLERKPRYSQTPDLWKVSAYPVAAVKDAVDLFIDYVRSVDTDDRVGLVVYNSSNGNGKLETGLTHNLDHVVDLTLHRQAGHYHVYTNIGAGMETARIELENHGRRGAFKMIVLMTDGRANWNNGRYSTSAARNHVLSEAAADANLRYPVVAISLGGGADTYLMNQIAEITKSQHFNVPGGQMVDAYRNDLIQVFRDIADARPLKLVPLTAPVRP